MYLPLQVDFVYRFVCMSFVGNGILVYCFKLFQFFVLTWPMMIKCIFRYNNTTSSKIELQFDGIVHLSSFVLKLKSHKFFILIDLKGIAGL